MCGHARGLRGRTDGQAGTSNPAAERRDRLLPIIRSDLQGYLALAFDFLTYYGRFEALGNENCF